MPSTTKAGKNNDPPIRQESVPSHQQDQNAKADQEIHERHNDGGYRHDQARKIDLADQLFVVDQAIGSLAQPGGKESPRQDAGEHHQRVRRVAVRRQFGDAAENDGEYQHGEKGANERPQHADDRLLIADRQDRATRAPGTARDIARGPANSGVQTYQLQLLRCFSFRYVLGVAR